ncbi:MAG: hypothetical protein KIH08_14810, partial [Candidatus Freyarchaeota archaeon]|nr:hypothetical protein [Candidatus Jordarchaeia archaeon]
GAFSASVLITSLILRSSSRMPVHPPLLLYSPTFKLFFNKFRNSGNLLNNPQENTIETSKNAKQNKYG